MYIETDHERFIKTMRDILRGENEWEFETTTESAEDERLLDIQTELQRKFDELFGTMDEEDE